MVWGLLLLLLGVCVGPWQSWDVYVGLGLLLLLLQLLLPAPTPAPTREPTPLVVPGTAAPTSAPTPLEVPGTAAPTSAPTPAQATAGFAFSWDEDMQRRFRAHRASVIEHVQGELQKNRKK